MGQKPTRLWPGNDPPWPGGPLCEHYATEGRAVGLDGKGGFAINRGVMRMPWWKVEKGRQLLGDLAKEHQVLRSVFRGPAEPAWVQP